MPATWQEAVQVRAKLITHLGSSFRLVQELNLLCKSHSVSAMTVYLSFERGTVKIHDLFDP